jgi:hypothetical protein
MISLKDITIDFQINIKITKTGGFVFKKNRYIGPTLV